VSKFTLSGNVDPSDENVLAVVRTGDHTFIGTAEFKLNLLGVNINHITPGRSNC